MWFILIQTLHVKLTYKVRGPTMIRLSIFLHLSATYNRIEGGTSTGLSRPLNVPRARCNFDRAPVFTKMCAVRSRSLLQCVFSPTTQVRINPLFSRQIWVAGTDEQLPHFTGDLERRKLVFWEVLLAVLSLGEMFANNSVCRTSWVVTL